MGNEFRCVGRRSFSRSLRRDGWALAKKPVEADRRTTGHEKRAGSRQPFFVVMSLEGEADASFTYESVGHVRAARVDEAVGRTEPGRTGGPVEVVTVVGVICD